MKKLFLLFLLVLTLSGCKEEENTTFIIENEFDFIDHCSSSCSNNVDLLDEYVDDLENLILTVYAAKMVDINIYQADIIYELSIFEKDDLTHKLPADMFNSPYDSFVSILRHLRTYYLYDQGLIDYLLINTAEGLDAEFEYGFDEKSGFFDAVYKEGSEVKFTQSFSFNFDNGELSYEYSLIDNEYGRITYKSFKDGVYNYFEITHDEYDFYYVDIENQDFLVFCPYQNHLYIMMVLRK